MLAFRLAAPALLVATAGCSDSRLAPSDAASNAEGGAGTEGASDDAPRRTMPEEGLAGSDAASAAEAVLNAEGPASSEASNELPMTPAHFSIVMSRSACFGDCPAYELSLTSDGTATYFGRSCVARHGFFEANVDGDAARTLYDALRAAVEQAKAPGEERFCATDGSWLHWEVDADEAHTELDFDLNCEGETRVLLLDVEASLLDAYEAQALIGESYANCGLSNGVGAPDVLVLSAEGEPQGLLHNDPQAYRWTVQDCEGEDRAAGFVADEGAGSVLLPESPALFEWPGATGVHSVTLRFGDTSTYSVIIDAQDGEQTQSAEAGTRCPL